MELEYLVKSEIKLQPPFNKSCLYIIEPNDLPERLKHCRRCGVAGTRYPRVKEGEAALWCFSLSLDQRGKKVVESPRPCSGRGAEIFACHRASGFCLKA